jgi:signal transduction histidine kinase
MRLLGWLRRAARRHPHADIAIAVVLYAVTLLTTVAGVPAARGRFNLPLAAVAAVACGVLVARQRWPLLTLGVSAVGAEAYMVQLDGHSLVLAAPLIALYTIAEAASRRRAVAIGALAVFAIAGMHALLKPGTWLGAENLALAALGALAVAAGDASRSRRAYTAEVEVRARRAEAGREQEARRRVTEERLRIARDLHDVLGHQLALISVQAGVADHLLADRPAAARQALAHVRAASRTALGELRDTIGLLREPGEPVAPVEPAAGLAGLDELVASFRRSGMRVEVTVDGPARPLPPVPDLTAYRVVQESLTNAFKHARGATGRGATARLRLCYRPSTLDIEVEDDGTAAVASDPLPGHGIAGMRERVAALGGSLSTGPRPAGGYQVRASLPLAAALADGAVALADGVR